MSAELDLVGDAPAATPRPGFPGATPDRVCIHPLARARAPIDISAKTTALSPVDVAVFDGLPGNERQQLSEAGHVKDGRTWRVPKAVRLELFLFRVSQGATDAEAARAAGYPEAAVLTWMQDADFVSRYNTAKASGYSADAILEAAVQRALNGSDKMLEFLLCNLMPDRFRKTDRTEVQVSVNLAERIVEARRRAG